MCINHNESISWLWNHAFSIHWWIIILDPLGGIYASGQLKTKLSLTAIRRWRRRDVYTNDQEAEEYGQPAGLLFLLGLDPCLHWKNWLGCWGCRRRWLDSCCCSLKGLIAVAIRVIGLAARTQSWAYDQVIPQVDSAHCKSLYLQRHRSFLSVMAKFWYRILIKILKVNATELFFLFLFVFW